MNKEVNKEKIDDSLKYVELKDRIDELPQGLDTYLFKNFDESGIELSGGQMQKLAFTRALYKDTPIILLDEPVASLDPLSEYEIYKKYKDMSEGKTSIFVSHRLASTRFTDVIAVFDNGEIVEYGNHDVLIQSNGIYHEMFMTQAKYYQL